MERINNSLINANIKLVDENKELKKEIERLSNIIKEVREYIGEPNDNYWCEEARYILEMLKGE